MGLIDLSRPVLLLNRFNGGRLAIGDPSHVPAGQYAKAALESLGLWPAVRDRLAPQNNVRAILAFVERGEAPLGIIYATDAALSPNVRIAAIIPGSAHDPIVYASAMISGRATREVRDFYDALGDEQSDEVFSRFGFGTAQQNE